MPVPILAIILAFMLPAPNVYKMRVTGYYAAPGVQGALAQPIRPGGTAAVSPGCIGLLGEKVYVRGHGVFVVNDLAADWLDEQHGICTLDLAAPSVKSAQTIGNSTKTVVRIR